MSFRNIGQVYCSLNLGMIYSLDYSYSPHEGVAITLCFINESGVYNKPPLLPEHKVSIVIGGASFSMIPVRTKVQYAQGHRTMSVDFVDEMKNLNNWYVTLKGKGCGFGIYQLGIPVDNRTLAQKQAAALDPSAEQVSDFTEFPDLEYTFNEFMSILRQRFNVQILAAPDHTIKYSEVGTFRDVLDRLTSSQNLSYFFENGVIKIFNPARLSITLPAPPVDAISYSDEEDITSTYSKTVCNWFQQAGGQFGLNQSNASDGNLLVGTATLYPIGYAFGLSQNLLDLNQVVAAQYGQQFWFLYNYYKGSTAANCGWAPIAQTTLSSFDIYKTIQGLVAANSSQAANIAVYDEAIYNGQFQAFQQYGSKVAGQYYLSDEVSDISLSEQYQWFNEVNGQIFNFTDAEVAAKAVTPTYLSPSNVAINQIPGTPINTFYSGVNYFGQRMALQDVSRSFALSSGIVTLQGLVDTTYNQIFNVKGSESMDFSEVGTNRYQAFLGIPVPQELATAFDGLSNQFDQLQPRYSAIPLKGIKKDDYTNLKASQNESDNIGIITTSGPTVFSNTSVIKTVKNGTYTVYYQKYQDCASANSAGEYYQRRFDVRQVSPDVQIGYTFAKLANNTYRLDRDFSVVTAIVHNPYLGNIAQARTFPNRKVSFSLNYFYDVPVSFLSNGLVNMSVSVDDQGITSTYTFSNEVLEVRNYDNAFAKYQAQVLNSATRPYRPPETIG